MHELLADYLQRSNERIVPAAQIFWPLCSTLLTSRLIHKSSSASEATVDRPNGEVADAACQKPTWGGGGG